MVMAFLRVFAILLALTPACLRAQERDVVVFAAASMKTALDDIAAGFTRQTGARVVVSYAASSALARQIEQGAPAQIFISADSDWMDYLAARRLISPESRRDLVGNSLVLIGARDFAGMVELTGPSLAQALAGGRLATGATSHVPSGKYARSALEHLGLWAGVASRLAETENVRAALSLVARGEAPLGIVYETDAHAEPSVRILARFPHDSHPVVVYPAALVSGVASGAAANLLAYLTGKESMAIFRREGFSPAPR